MPESELTIEEMRANLPRHSFYVIFMHQTDQWSAVAKQEREAVLREHLLWQGSLEQAGTLFLAGPLDISESKPWTGMMVIRAASREEALRVVEDEPFARAGLRRNEVRHWQINEGCIRISVGLMSRSVILE